MSRKLTKIREMLTSVATLDIREMLTSVATLDKEINMETLHWEMMKSGMFHFRKVKKLLSLIKKNLFLTFLTSAPGALVNTTLKIKTSEQKNLKV
jgi:uncharacterized membrane protein